MQVQLRRLKEMQVQLRRLDKKRQPS